MAKATVESIRALLADSGLVDDASSLRADVPLKEQGLDSLDSYNLYLSVEETYGVQIPDEEIPGLDTLEAVVRYVNERV